MYESWRGDETTKVVQRMVFGKQQIIKQFFKSKVDAVSCHGHQFTINGLNI